MFEFLRHFLSFSVNLLSAVPLTRRYNLYKFVKIAYTKQPNGPEKFHFGYDCTVFFYPLRSDSEFSVGSAPGLSDGGGNPAARTRRKRAKG
jgi:hypothetical protein